MEARNNVASIRVDPDASSLDAAALRGDRFFLTRSRGRWRQRWARLQTCYRQRRNKFGISADRYWGLLSGLQLRSICGYIKYPTRKIYYE
jgi:hypothetical protein